MKFKTVYCLILFAILSSWAHAQDSANFEFDDLSKEIGAPGKARIIRLTAHLGTINKSSTPIDRYIYRLTIPPNTQSQKCFVESSTTPVAATKAHKNECNQYIELEFPVEARGEHQIDVSFLVLVRPVNFGKASSIELIDELSDEQKDRWVEPSKLIESDSKEVLSAAKKVFEKCKDDSKSLARAAYQFPDDAIKFKLQKQSLGAQKVLQTGIGDCTEHACLFAALCRTKNIPARKISVFNFGKNTKIKKSVPNHHIAECYLDSHGWIPVDPTLGNKRNSKPVGFAKLGNYYVIYNREGAWVWQTRLPKGGYDKSLAKPKVEYTISWDGEVVAEGGITKIKQQFNEYFSQSRKNGDALSDVDGG